MGKEIKEASQRRWHWGQALEAEEKVFRKEHRLVAVWRFRERREVTLPRVVCVRMSRTFWEKSVVKDNICAFTILFG